MSDIEPEVTDAPEPEAAAPEPVADAAPEQDAPAGFSPDDPALLEMVDLRAAELVNQRLAQVQPPDSQEPQGPQLDLNEYLNPLGDSYGENMARFLADRDQFILGEMRKLVEPLMEPVQEQRQTQAMQLVDQFITDRWNPTDGELTDVHRDAIRGLAPTYLGEMNQRFGEGPLAAQQALVKAAETIRQINKVARANGSAANAAELQAAANPGTPGGGTAAVQAAEQPASVEEALERWKSRNTQAQAA